MRALLPLLVLCACFGLAGQRRGEIPLSDGEGAVQGRLAPRQEKEYDVIVPGQTLTLALDATPPRSLAVTVSDAAGAGIPLQRVGAGRWNATLPKAGRYRITVFRGRPSEGAARYRLVVMAR